MTDVENEMWTTLDEAGVWVITGGVDVSGSEAEVTFAFLSIPPRRQLGSSGAKRATPSRRSACYDPASPLSSP